MKLEEARKLATPGRIRVVYDKYADLLTLKRGAKIIAEIYPRDEARLLRSKERVDAALLAHEHNTYMELVDALERRIERAKDEYPKHQWEEEGILRDEAVLTRAKEVPGI